MFELEFPEPFEDESLYDLLSLLAAIRGIREIIKRDNYTIKYPLICEWAEQFAEVRGEFRKKLREARQSGDAEWVVVLEQLEDASKEALNSCLYEMRN